MKIHNISIINNNLSKYQERKKNNQQSYNEIKHIKYTNIPVYKDYNISFSGRTPEDFYSQEFNRNNMPDSMKEYLNFNYEERQHIPPEQMMHEVFKYLEIADDFQDVKDIYPNEKLFDSLHENNQNNRSSILWEIKVAKQLSDEPLLKDGSNNFGMYLLKKIYLEGKTVKEISKDFYEKDINDNYKGIITKPIDSQTTAAYGIRYPKSAFWHSFIATREEYKKFFITLPKNATNPAVHLKNRDIPTSKETNSNKTKIEKPNNTRKYKLKDYHKKQLTEDIKESQANTQEIEKKIRKRFAKEDPQASFIVKYLSPIMTVAAERIHLSEEIKNFSETENEQGKIGDEEYMFKRFWKHNPKLLNYYAQTITDTIDLFEDIYGEGGLLPINRDLEVIKENSENKTAVDYVNPEFVELLNYTQTIYPEREKRYDLHNKLQREWDEHFINKYGVPETDNTIKLDIDKIDNTQKLNEISTTKNNIQETYKQSLEFVSEVYPSDYASKYIKYMLNNKEIDNDYKAAYSRYIGNKEVENVRLSEDEFHEKFNKIESDFIYDHERDSVIAKLAIIEILARNNLHNYKLYTLNTYNFPTIDKIDKQQNVIRTIIKKDKKQLNQLYSDYKAPLKTKEINKIVNELFNQIQNYKTQDEITENNTNQILLMLKESCNTPPRAELIKYILKFSVTKFLPFSKSILNPNESESEKRAKFENIMLILIVNFLNNSKDLTLAQMIGDENLQKGFRNLSEDVQMALISKINNMSLNELGFFKFKHSEYMKDYNENPQMCNEKYGFIFT